MHAASANVGSAIGAATAAAEAFKEKPYQTTAVALAALSLVFNVVVRVFSTTQTTRVTLLSGADPVAHRAVVIADVRPALPTWRKSIARCICVQPEPLVLSRRRHSLPFGYLLVHPEWDQLKIKQRVRLRGDTS